MKVNMMKVNEIFGPSIQGEGINIGCPSIFLRLSGCNLASCRWCDSKYSWNEGHDLSNSQIREEISRLAEKRSIYHLVITGGEPMMQAKELKKFLKKRPLPWITIETNGHYSLDLLGEYGSVFWSISPKLPSSGCYKPFSDLPTQRFGEILNSQWKFVVSNSDDQVVLWHELQQRFYRNAIIQPCSVEGSLSYRELIEWAKKLWAAGINIRVLPQAHVLAWGQKRGV